MRGIMALLCLTAALSGPLLRQAEAAGDFARALVALLDIEGTIVTPDGGVGDDSGETTLKTGGGVDVASLGRPCWDRPAGGDGLPRSTLLTPTRPDLGAPQRQQVPTAWLPDGAGRRHAWLQLLLI